MPIPARRPRKKRKYTFKGRAYRTKPKTTKKKQVATKKRKRLPKQYFKTCTCH